MHFTEIKEAVAHQWQRMSSNPLFRTTIGGDQLWETYLGSFPDGTNPIYRKRTQHDCSCCRQFIRSVGNVVAIIDGQLTSIWDVNMHSPAYQTVAQAMAALVKSQPIDNVFLHTEATAGTDKNYERKAKDDPMAQVLTWEHFFVRMPNSRVKAKDQIGITLGEACPGRPERLRTMGREGDRHVYHPTRPTLSGRPDTCGPARRHRSTIVRYVVPGVPRGRRARAGRPASMSFERGVMMKDVEVCLARYEALTLEMLEDEEMPASAIMGALLVHFGECMRTTVTNPETRQIILDLTVTRIMRP